VNRFRAISTAVLAALMVVLGLGFALRAIAQPLPGGVNNPGPSWATGGPAPNATTRPGETAAPTGGPLAAHRHVSLRADQLIHSEHKTIARGHAVAITESAYIEADEIEVDHDTDMLHARKNVVIRMNGDEIHAEAATYDFKRGVADLQDAFGIARNITLYHNSLEDSFYFWSPRIRWDGKVLRLIKGVMTSCNLPPSQLHYKITGNVINVYPGDRMEIRKARVYYENKQVIGRELLVFSLHPRRRQNLVPQLGYNTYDGAFVKENFAFSLNNETYGRIFADFYQKSGIGHGAELTYGLGSKGIGNFSFYELSAPPNTHRSRYRLYNLTQLHLSPSMTGVFLYENDRYDSTNPQIFTPTTKVLGMYLYDYGPRHSLQIAASNYQAAPASSAFYGVLYKQTLTDRVSNDLEISYQKSKFDIYNSYFYHALDRLSYHAPLFDSDLLLEKTSFTGTPIFLVNRLPELVVRSRLFNLGPVPLRLSMSAGALQEQPSGAKVGRYNLQFQARHLLSGRRSREPALRRGHAPDAL
jgi:hypothetical protein